MSIENAHFRSAGKFISREPWIHPDITISTTEIIIVTDGTVRIAEGEEPYTLPPGSVLFLSPDTRHYGLLPAEEHVSFYWLHLSDYDPSDSAAPLKRFTLKEPFHVSILCRQLLHYQSTGAGSDVTDRLLYLLLHELASQSRADDNSESGLFRRIREWIRTNSDRSITAPDVAEAFGYNEDYISRICKRYYGYGLKTLINEMKINYVKYLLLERDLTLAEIADAAGFSDYKLFLKFFKYHEGTSPSEYKRINYGIHTNNH